MSVPPEEMDTCDREFDVCEINFQNGCRESEFAHQSLKVRVMKVNSPVQLSNIGQEFKFAGPTFKNCGGEFEFAGASFKIAVVNSNLPAQVSKSRS